MPALIEGGHVLEGTLVSYAETERAVELWFEELIPEYDE